jgi:hypothetical protein
MRNQALQPSFAVGQDLQWGHLVFEWEEDTLSVTRDGQLMLEMSAITKITLEQQPDNDGGERGLLRIESRKTWRAFFIDRNDTQSNLREVDASLTTLSSVLDWLLPPGFVYRQGDIGIYQCATPPCGPSSFRVEAHQRAFAPVLGSRHRFDRPERCAFILADGRYFVAVRTAVNLIHPEHPLVAIDAGTYELVAARGRTLPGVVTIAAAQASTMPL